MPAFTYELLTDSALPWQGPAMMLSRTCPSRLHRGSQTELKREGAHLSAFGPYFAVQYGERQVVKIHYGKDWSFGGGGGIVEPTDEIPAGCVLQTRGRLWEDKNPPGRKSGGK